MISLEQKNSLEVDWSLLINCMIVLNGILFFTSTSIHAFEWQARFGYVSSLSVKKTPRKH
jgi:hypothetical protein